jgi:hypothetical protein
MNMMADFRKGFRLHLSPFVSLSNSTSSRKLHPIDPEPAQGNDIE